ncbi:MAG: hypothetical protein ACKVVP_10625 [Chloroflexota bacterium]
MRFNSVSSMIILLVVLLSAACSPAAPASPTVAPAKPTSGSPEAAKPVASPAAPSASPVASPAASPAAAALIPAPAAAPAGAKPSFSEQAVADFYRGKTIKILVGYAPGGGYDTFSRMAARTLPKHIPGNPSIIVENRPGAGSIVAANAVYNTEVKDGTVIASFSEGAVLQQVVGADGIQFDSARYQWLGGNVRTSVACMVRNDSGIRDFSELLSGRSVNTPSPGRGNSSHDFPQLMNGLVNTQFKLITGYAGFPEAQAAFEKNEGEALCVAVDVLVTRLRNLVDGPNAIAKVIVHSGGGTPDLQDSLLRGVPSVMDSLPGEEAKSLMGAMNTPLQFVRPLAVAPEVPADRVAALRWALDQTFRDPQFADDIKGVSPNYSVAATSSGSDVNKVITELFALPQPVRDRLKVILSQ